MPENRNAFRIAHPKTKIVAILAVSVMAVTGLASGALAANAAAPNTTTASQSQGRWVWSKTEWQDDTNKPVDQYGPDVKWGAREERTVPDQPGSSYTVDHQAVTEDVVIPATPDTAGQRWEWHPDKQANEATTKPTWPSAVNGYWGSNNKKWDGTDPLGEVFQQGGGNGGDNASWFYWELIPGQPERTETMIVKEAWTEIVEQPGTTKPQYRWAVATWVKDTNTPNNTPSKNDPQGNDPKGNDLVVTDPQGNDPKGTDPQGTDPQGNEPKGNDPVVKEVDNQVKQAPRTSKPATTDPATVPTSIDAGL